uniref:Uncharacterized protein LOC105642119 isoform X4 n=1 Tax=Rhizophora mucronata TaxID=61149 RepID=A0A2P2JLL0_RHIMU
MNARAVILSNINLFLSDISSEVTASPLIFSAKHRRPRPPSPISVSCRRNHTGGQGLCSTPPSTAIAASAAVGSLVIETATATAGVTVGEEEEEEELKEAEAVESVARRLILLRHAQSSGDDPSLRDHDRPLSKDGQADAAKVSQKLRQLGWIPQLILCSDAIRTRETLKIMQEQVPSFSDAEVHFISSFYSIAAMDGQTAEHLQVSICKYSRDEILTVMWVLLSCNNRDLSPICIPTVY